MKKIFEVRIIVFLMMMLMILAQNAQAANGTAELVIFHTNDTHARVSADDDNGESIGLAEMSAVVKAEKLKNPDTLWLDAGDTLHGLPKINISNGENMVLLLNETSIDAIAPGNHDYNYGAAQLQKLSKELKMTVLSANTVKTGTKKQIFKPYKIYKLSNKVKIGVFGLSTPETAYKANPKNTVGVEFLNPVEQAQLMVKKLKSKCDVVVAVMHMGLDASSEYTSERIAQEVSGIDLIVDGHSHTELPQGLEVGNTLIVQTGSHGHNLGRVQINIENHKIVSKNAKLLDKSEIKKLAPIPDLTIRNTLEKIEVSNEKLFSEVVAHSDRELSGDRLLVRRYESELGNLCADACRWRTGADIAVVNGGDMRTDLPAGDVTRGDIMAIFPFGSNIQVAEVNGKTIREMLEHSVFGFPAAFGGFLTPSGLTFSFDPTKPAGQRVSDIYIDGKELDDNKIYKLAASDFLFVGGDDYEMLKNQKIIGNYDSCEEIVADYINKVGMSGIEVGRIKQLKEVPIPDESTQYNEAA